MILTNSGSVVYESFEEVQQLLDLCDSSSEGIVFQDKGFKLMHYLINDGKLDMAVCLKDLDSISASFDQQMQIESILDYLQKPMGFKPRERMTQSVNNVSYDFDQTSSTLVMYKDGCIGIFDCEIQIRTSNLCNDILMNKSRIVGKITLNDLV